MTESQLVNALIEELQYRKIFCWRNNNTPTYDQSREIFRKMPKYSMHGVPDIAGIMPDGKALYIEVKLPKGKLSLAQKAFLARAKTLGAIALVAYNAQDIHNELTAAGYRNFGPIVKPESRKIVN